MVTTDNTHIDTIAENMLLYQRAIGGWPKAVNEIKVDYKARLTETDKKNIRNDSLHNDATIDNNATSKEIRYLVNAYKKTGNEKYLAAAEKGIYYCLLAQRNNGGWPQYYPDSSLYRGQITFNDDAMINVMDILQDIVEGKKGFELVGKYLVSLSANAIQRGVACILKTQIKTGNQLTAWCAQYNPKTFEPEMARKFELASLSGSESVGIVRFLMRLPNPSPQIKESVMAAVEWLGMVKITGYSFGDITNADGKKDRVLQSSPNNSIWARFYEIGSNKPIFSGRDSIKKYDVKEIESERRNGYAWYGTWPKNLLEKEYPEWAKKNLIKS
jgi:PelA/Pel-15E family pectate lyase